MVFSFISAQFSIPSAINLRAKNFNFAKCTTNHLSSTKMWMRYSDCTFFCVHCVLLAEFIVGIYSFGNLFLVFSYFLVSVVDWFKMRTEHSLFILNWLRLRPSHLRLEHFYFDYNRYSRWQFRCTRIGTVYDIIIYAIVYQIQNTMLITITYY